MSTPPSPPAPTPPASPHTQPNHNIIFTIPRTSSHLLLRILNLPPQLSIHRHSSDGYFFVGPLVQRLVHNLSGKDISTWSDEERNGMRNAFQKSWEGYEAFLREAEQEGQKEGRRMGTVVKDHVNWWVDPVREWGVLHTSASQDGDISSNSTPDSRENGGRGGSAANRTQTPAPMPSPLPSSPFTITPHTKILPTISSLNETPIPDAFLLTLRPTFLIRNPLLTFPSLLRTSIDNEGLETALASEEMHRWEMSFHWSRALYEFYISASENAHNDDETEIPKPIILDADDIHNPQLISHYARLIGLDASLIQYSWSPASDTEIKSLSSVEKRMRDTLLRSSGIVKGKTSEELGTLEEEVERWKGEFGEVLSGRLERAVRGEGGMRDYWWLWERRLRV